MEVGKRVEEEAGPSSAGKMDEFRSKSLPETASEETEVGEDEVDDKDGFSPGPLLSLKEQLEKDKVSFFSVFFLESLFFFVGDFGDLRVFLVSFCFMMI